MGGNELLEQIKAMLLEEYSVSQWVLLFFLYSFCGWCWEVFLYLVKERRFVNRGFLFGPILPIYGFGAVGILLTCVPVEGNMALVALVGTIAASLLEYVTGFLMESIFHVRYWDYSQRPLNLNGYICALSAATWAVFSVIIVSVVNPFVKNYIYMIPLTMADAAAAVLVGFARGGYRFCRPPRPRFARLAGIHGALRQGAASPARRAGFHQPNMSAA